MKSAALGFLFVGVLLVACDLGNSTADKATCEKMADHEGQVLMTPQMAALAKTPAGVKMLTDMRTQTITSCTGKMSSKEASCRTTATTPAAVQACAGK